MIELFLELFTRTFELRLEQLVPSALTLSLLGEQCAEKLDAVESTRFIDGSAS